MLERELQDSDDPDEEPALELLYLLLEHESQ